MKVKHLKAKIPWSLDVPRSEGAGNYWNLKRDGAVCAGEGCSEEAVGSGGKQRGCCFHPAEVLRRGSCVKEQPNLTPSAPQISFQ